MSRFCPTPPTTIALLLCLALSPACGVAARAQVPVVHDDFETVDIDQSIWWPRTIATERWRIDETIARSGRRSLAIEVEPGDRDPRDPSIQRNEIWLREHLWEPADSDRWYGFSFRLSGDIAAMDNLRWVIGQWKEENSAFSPFLAQRLRNGIFYITVQDNDCMVRIAQAAGNPDQMQRMGPSAMMIERNARSLADVELGRSMRGPCTSSIHIEPGETRGILPSPIDAWVDMIYRVRRGRNGQGVVEVWANGRSVVRAAGSIGNDGAGPGSYFKIGMYRDIILRPATLHFDNFRRGNSREEVDPAPR